MAKPISKTPLHLQLRDIVLRRIMQGDWAPEAPLPNELELAREFGLSPGTVRKAFDWLEAAGFVVRQQGKGTYVVDPTSHDLTARFDKVRNLDGSFISGTIEILEFAIEPAGEPAGGKLEIEASAPACRITQLRRLAAGAPYQFEISSMPAALFPKLVERPGIGRGITEIAFANGVALGAGLETVELAPLPGAAARALDLPADSLTLRLERVVRSVEGTLIEWRLAWCHPGNVMYLAQSR